jgi:hypothetical protein
MLLRNVTIMGRDGATVAAYLTAGKDELARGKAARLYLTDGFETSVLGARSAAPGRLGIERRAIDLVVIAIGDADRATLTLQLGLHLRQLAGQLNGAIGGDLDIFENDSALVLELFTDHEIEGVVRHPNSPV